MQEWLLAPSYTIYANLPEPWHSHLRDRLERGALHYSPCMGLSEMLAEITYLGEEDAEALPYGAYEIESAICLEYATLRAKEALERELFLQTLPMPHHVTEDRIFSLKNYLLERDGKPLPVETSHAYQLPQKVISFL
jgi:CRISPR-associated protein Cas5h